MTEAEWLASTDVRRMLAFRGRHVSGRKLLLFGAACCRRIWHLLVEGRSRQAVEATERFADGLIIYEEEWDDAVGAADAAVPPEWPPADADAVTYAAFAAAHAYSAHFASDYAADAAGSGECAAQADLLRDIFGNPFRPAPMNQAWRTPAVVSIARRVYDDRDFGALPVLADALEEAGCTNGDILAHCRSGGEHVRGCWALDLLTGKE